VVDEEPNAVRLERLLLADSVEKVGPFELPSS
jgi:hypothetical protein